MWPIPFHACLILKSLQHISAVVPSPLGHDEVAVDRCPQCDVNAAHRVDVAKHQQHGPWQGLQHLHDVVKVAGGHFAHVRRLFPVKDVPQAKLPHVDWPLQEHLAEQEVV